MCKDTIKQIVMKKITLPDLRQVLEKREEFVKILSDKELLSSTLHKDLGLDSQKDFIILSKGLDITKGLKPGRPFPLHKIINFYSKEYEKLTVKEYMDEVNKIISDFSK